MDHLGWRTNSDSLDVFACKRIAGGWSTPVNITANLPGSHWFADVAVDRVGNPHIVWEERGARILLYTTYQDSSWSTPHCINDPQEVPTADWAAPQIFADSNGYLHVAWVGETSGRQEVLYSVRAPSHWRVPLQISRLESGNSFYPSIAVVDSTNIWVTWENDEESGPVATTCWSARTDGQNVFQQTRLDTGRYFFNQLPRLAIDNRGFPWACWGGLAQDYSDDAVFASGFDSPTPVVFSDFTSIFTSLGVRLKWRAHAGVFDNFEIQRSRDQSFGFQLLGNLPAGPSENYEWLDQSPNPGRNWYRVLGANPDGSSILLGSILVIVPERLTLRVNSPANHSRIEARLSLPRAGTVAFELFDLQGRRTPWEYSVFLPAGEHALALPISIGLGPGEYFIRAELAGVPAAFNRVVWLPR